MGPLGWRRSRWAAATFQKWVIMNILGLRIDRQTNSLSGQAEPPATPTTFSRAAPPTDFPLDPGGGLTVRLDVFAARPAARPTSVRAAIGRTASIGGASVGERCASVTVVRRLVWVNGRMVAAHVAARGGQPGDVGGCVRGTPRGRGA